MRFNVWAYFMGCSNIEAMGADYASMLLNDWCDLDKTGETVMTKSVFLEVEVEPLKPPRNHTHGESAATRSTASLLVDRICRAAGKTPTYIQGSAADLRQGRKITRNYFWVKDLQVPEKTMEEAPQATAMIDVDYYVDMNKFLTQHFVPHFLYTFVPSRAAKDSGEYSFTFTKEGKVKYSVSGGATYEHFLWDWTGDSLIAVRKFWGIPYKVSTYCLERRVMDEDHQLILLAPLKQFRGIISSWLALRRLSGKQLERFNPVQGDFVRMYVNSEKGMSVSTGKVGCYGSSFTSASVDDAITAARNTSSLKLQLATVKSKLEKGASDPAGAELLLEYHLTGRKPAPAVSLLNAVRRFQWVPPGRTYDQDAKPGMVAFMSPLIDGAFVPDNCFNNDERAVVERVLKIANGDTHISGFVSSCMDEFIELFHMGRSYYLEPVENDVVYARQNKPTQRRILDCAQQQSANDKASNFVKKEAYQTVTDPRMISQINGVDKMAYSSYVYAIADVIKKHPWYAFGKSPLEIAERVADVCENSITVSETDFSRMDGRVGPVAREFERRLMIFGFKTEHHLRLYELMRKQYCLRGVTSHGYRYATGFARSSGSPETSAFNTALNAFVCYMAYRRMMDAFGAYLSPMEAWNRLGIYGGDDGLSGDLDSRCAQSASKSVGQVLELNTIKRGAFPVSFLARRYGPDVWYGAVDSCCSVLRTLSKFHTTVHLPRNITAVDKLKDKAFALCLTDANTPVVGRFVKKVLELYPMKSDEFRNLSGHWIVDIDPEKQYPNRYGDWMDTLVEQEIPTLDYNTFSNWVENATHENILHPPTICNRPEPSPKPGTVVVDGDVVSSESSKTTPEESTEGSADTSKTKRWFRARKPKSQRKGYTNKQARLPAGRLEKRGNKKP